MDLRLTVGSQTDTTNIACVGRLVYGDEAASLRARVKGLIAQGAKSIILDLAGVRYIDSGALGVLTGLESWLYQIATHVSIDRMRQRAKAAERHLAQPVEDLPIADATYPSALTVIQQEEMSACVQQYVAKLSDAYKAVLLLCDADGLSANETTELLQLQLTTVKMRLHRARRKLQVALKAACEFECDGRGVFICEPKRDQH